MHFQYSEDEGKQGGGAGKGLGGGGGAGGMGGGNPVPPPPPDGSLLDGLGVDAMGAARGKALKDKKARDKKAAAALPNTLKPMTPTGVSPMVTQAQLAQVTQSLQLQGHMGAMEKKKKGSTPPPPPPPDESGLGADVKSLSAIGVVSMLQMDEAGKLPTSMTGLEAGKDMVDDFGTGEVPAVAAVAKVGSSLPRLPACLRTFRPALHHASAAGKAAG